MSDANRSSCGLTRRSFLKTTAVAAGAAAVGSAAAPPLHALAAEQYRPGRPPTDGEQVFRGVCRPNCFGFCHLNVHVRDGHIVKTSRAPYTTTDQYNRICHRGLSHVQRVYDPDRLKYPLRRVEGSARGAGEWERVGWDEATQEIADKITQLQADYGKQAVAALTISGNMSVCNTNMYTCLWNVLQATNIAANVDNGSYYGAMRMCGPLTQMWESNELTDIVNAKHIVAIAANITDAQVQNWHFIKEAMQNGTTLTVIDPTFTQVAAKADRWIPIRPGCDMALYMGLGNIFVERDAIDVDYLTAQTCAPFLVHPETKRFMRASDTGVPAVHTGELNPLTGQEVVIDPYMVAQGGVPVALDEATAPELDARVTYEGLEFRTAYSLLKDELAKFPPDRVSQMTDIPVDTLNELADLYLDGPVTTYVGYGSQAYMNGAHTTHAGFIMSALVGNLGKPGASYGSFWHYFMYGNMAFTMPTGPNPTPPIQSLDFANVMRTGTHLGQEFPVKMLYVYAGNPLSTCPDTNSWLNEVWPKLDFVVVADSQMTDTARYADLVLPIAQWFEVMDVTQAGQTVCLSYNEKAIDPLYESKSDPDIVRMIADKLGIGEYFQLSDEDVIRDFLDNDICRMFGLTFDNIKLLGDMRFAADNPHVAWGPASPYTSASGRLEFYLEDPFPRAAASKPLTPELMDRERLPHWFPPAEAWPENEIMRTYPFVLMSERPRFRVHSQWFNVRALRELDPEPTVKVSPTDAEPRGIRAGDYVECFNDRGRCVAKAVLSNAVRPGTLVYPKSWQMAQHKAGSWSELLSTDFDAFCINSNFMDVVCDIRVWSGGEGA